MNKSIAYTVITFCFLMTMVPLHAEELTEAQTERDNRIFSQCFMNHYNKTEDENGFVTVEYLDSEGFINCLKCKKHTDFISAEGGENCDEM